MKSSNKKPPTLAELIRVWVQKSKRRGNWIVRPHDLAASGTVGWMFNDMIEWTIYTDRVDFIEQLSDVPPLYAADPKFFKKLEKLMIDGDNYPSRRRAWLKPFWDKERHRIRTIINGK
jgi:hypothetical protein